jgi:histidinol-phosphate aminotransferase
MSLLSLENFMRPEIVRMTPYIPIKPFPVLSAELGIPIEKIVKLDANENPYGPSPLAYEALAALGNTEVPIYPDPGSTALRQKLAEKLGVQPEMIVTGAGADELIEVLFKLFFSPDDVMINCPPTFGMYTFLGQIYGVKEVIIERDANFRLDINAIEAAVIQHQAKMVMLCAPNNPDGLYLESGALERLLKLNTIVLLDEAYGAFARPNLEAEFGAANSARLVALHPNLVVLRTFSKWAGLAGLRVGYGVAAPEVAGYMMAIKQPYNINVAAEAAASASLDDLPYLNDNVQKMLVERDRIYTELAQFKSLKAFPGSKANFILVEVLRQSAADLKAKLAQRGILVRYFAKQGLENHIRISIGTPEQTDQLIAVLRELV